MLHITLAFYPWKPLMTTQRLVTTREQTIIDSVFLPCHHVLEFSKSSYGAHVVRNFYFNNSYFFENFHFAKKISFIQNEFL